MHRSTPLLPIICALLLAWPIQVLAFEESDDPVEDNVLEALKPAVEHLLELTDYNSQAQFEPNRVTALLDFVTSPKPASETYTMGSRKGGASAYYEFSVKRSLQYILDLVYNPKVPSYVTTPSSLRLAYWVEIDGQRKSFPNLSAVLDDLSSPIIIKGIEFVENTPDATSGAYYSYELDRMLIIMQHKGQPLLISTSNQKKKSDVGRKGLVLGSDCNWNYLYTGEKGITKKGLGWADSYMYNSSSIMLYCQTAGPTPEVKFGSFKWLKAGWAGINLVEPVHLREGIGRFAKSFKEVLESPELEDLPKVTHMFEQISALSTDELRAKIKIYFNQLTERHGNTKKARKWFTSLFKDDQYVEAMSRQEMEAIVSIEYLKYLLGKDKPFDLSYFKPTKDQNQS